MYLVCLIKKLLDYRALTKLEILRHIVKKK